MTTQTAKPKVHEFETSSAAQTIRAGHEIAKLLHPPVLLSGWPEGDPRTSRIVFITRDLDRETVELGLRAFEDAARG